jgi:integrase
MYADSTDAQTARKTSPAAPPDPASKPAKARKTRNKTHRDLTLSVHKASGQWCKRRNGKVYYLGRVADDPNGIKAREEWNRKRTNIDAGRDADADESPADLSIEKLCFEYLAFQEARRDAREPEISPRTFQGLVATCKTVAEFFGRQRAVASLKPDDFGKLKSHLAKTRRLVALGNEIIRVRSIFKWAFDNEKVDRPIKYGSSFSKPKPEAIERARAAHRQKHGDKMFEADQIRAILNAADQPMKAMVLLACNCAFGQSDVSLLPIRAVDLSKGWVDFARVKTGRSRRIPLWPETIAAIEEWTQRRPKAQDQKDKDLLFLTTHGSRWVKLNRTGTVADALGQEFAKLLSRLGLKRAGVSFYAFRHGFETIAAELADQVAVDRVMGHRTPGMSSVYTERIGDDRLRRVVDHVRAWLFPAEPANADVEPLKLHIA